MRDAAYGRELTKSGLGTRENNFKPRIFAVATDRNFKPGGSEGRFCRRFLLLVCAREGKERRKEGRKKGIQKVK